MKKKYFLHTGWYTPNNCTDFIGEWKEYGKSDAKKCNFGIGFPEFFKHTENAMHVFDIKYINMGWYNFVYAYRNEIIISKNFPDTSGAIGRTEVESRIAEEAETESWNF